jgi:hypothetical protein
VNVAAVISILGIEDGHRRKFGREPSKEYNSALMKKHKNETRERVNL